MYSHTRVTAKPRATPHAILDGAPARTRESAISKSCRKLNAASTMQTRENTIASGPPSVSGLLPVNMYSSTLPTLRTTTPIMQPVRMRLNRGVTFTAPVLYTNSIPTNTPMVPRTAWPIITPASMFLPKLLPSSPVNSSETPPTNRPSNTA